jgi:hypothetical protein
LSRWNSEGDYSRLENLIAATEKSLQEYLNRDLTFRENFSRDYDGSGKNSLILEDYPIIELKGISYIDFNGSLCTFETQSINIDYNRGLLFMNNGNFPIGKRNIRVIGNFGFSTLPVDLKQAFLDQIIIATIIRSPSDIDMGNIKSQRIGNWSSSYQGVFDGIVGDLNKSSKAILDKYKEILI